MADQGRLEHLQDQLDRLEARAERERKRRQAAERIAEEITHDRYESQMLLEQALAAVDQRSQELEVRLEQQRRLQSISRQAIQQFDLEELLGEACTRVAEVLDIQYSDVFQLDPERESLTLIAGVGWPEEALGELSIDAGPGSQYGYTVENWEPTVVEDSREDERFRRPEGFVDADIVSDVTVAIPGPDHPWGVFGVHSPRPRAFADHDVTFVQTMARSLGQAIQRHRAHEALEREKTRFEALVEEITDHAIFRLDPEGHIRSWNDGAREIQGYTEEEVTGEHLSVLYPEEDRQAGRPEENLEAADQQGTASDEGWRVRKDGSRFWADVTITAFTDGEGQTRGFWNVVRDLTERRERERQLRSSNEQLREFARAASHDLQEPVRIVTIFLQLIRDRRGNLFEEEDWELFSYAEQGARQMRRMVQSLREFADVASRPPKLQPTGSRAVLEDVLTELQAEIEASGAEITVGELPSVEAEPRQLARLLRHLVSNALSFSGDKPPRIHIEAEPMDGEWRFSVSDEGIGVEEAYTDRIFEAFRHLGRGEPGAGLGLTICQHIVDRHEGDLWIESDPGEGSTFFFTLPAAETDEGG